ncbi:MAG: hypothetical protein AAF645_18065 [Myxococcota bacterium]
MTPSGTGAPPTARAADAIVVGIGELGGIFAKGLLRTGHRVTPVGRSSTLSAALERTPGADPIVVAVGEAELPAILQAAPGACHGRLVLLQNELLPASWSILEAAPTVASVWFEKKPGKPIHPIRSTPISGPRAEPITRALSSLGLPAHVVDAESMVEALVLKNLYILTANVAGLVAPAGTTTGALWNEHRDLALPIAKDVLTLQRSLVGPEAGAKLDGQALLNELAAAFLDDPKHGARGRSAPARLQRALGQARELGLTLPALAQVAP